ncbi:MAG: glutamate racemase [Williamsia sp.]|nr:glutamate racemase [Williamsia sp.]
MESMRPIGVFDSGYGGLTVLKEIIARLPRYDYLYLGDNARTPYGTRSFETVYQYTLQCVQWLFDQGCPLIILACNTASAKALRTIQQVDLPKEDPARRVLGVIRPTSEIIGQLTRTKQVGVLATTGTVQSGSYLLEIQKFFPGIKVFQEACPMWVPLIENGEHRGPGADYFVKKHIDGLLSQSDGIDMILLACTHYPLLQNKIQEFIPPHIQLVAQGAIVAASLDDYLQRHVDLAQTCTQEGRRFFYTTDSTEGFDKQAGLFFGQAVNSAHVSLQ